MALLRIRNPLEYRCASADYGASEIVRYFTLARSYANSLHWTGAMGESTTHGLGRVSSLDGELRASEMELWRHVRQCGSCREFYHLYFAWSSAVDKHRAELSALLRLPYGLDAWRELTEQLHAGGPATFHDYLEAGRK